MSTNTSRRPAIVGFFILVGVAILVVTIFSLGGQKKTFVKTFSLQAEFPDVGGLLKGGNVWYAGVKVGMVKKISVSGNSKVFVEMNLDNEVRQFIHKGSKARIGSDGLIGNKIVIIYGGENDLPLVDEADVLAVDKPLSTDDMLSTLQENNLNLLEITKAFKSISNKIENGQGILPVLLNDGEMAAKLRSTFSNANQVVSNLNDVSVKVQRMSARLERLTNGLTSPGSSVYKLSQDTTLFVSVKGALTQLERASRHAADFTKELETAGRQLNETNTVAGVLLRDSITAKSLRQTILNLETSTKKLDENLEALQHNFLFRRFFRQREEPMP